MAPYQWRDEFIPDFPGHVDFVVLCCAQAHCSVADGRPALFVHTPGIHECGMDFESLLNEIQYAVACIQTA